MELLTPGEVRAFIRTSLTDEQLVALIAREEAALVERLGPNYDEENPLVEVVEGEGVHAFLNRPITAVESVTEADTLGGTPAMLDIADYFIWHKQGRLERLPDGKKWGRKVTVTYQPVDDTARRKALLIDLIRLTLERTALKSESVAGEYSYTAPDWDADRIRLLRSHGFMRV